MGELANELLNEGATADSNEVAQIFGLAHNLVLSEVEESRYLWSAPPKTVP
jgi:hypothetical protein